jgi:hypothetical protein
MYLLGEKYVAAMGDLATSANAKTVVYPADLVSAFRGLLNKSS